MCRLTDDMASGTFDDDEREVSWIWRVIAFTAAMLLVGWLLSLQGCAPARTTARAISTVQANVEEDLQALLSRVHIDTQEFINHPERWGRVVDSLCTDGMILAPDCVQLKALLKARDIATGLRESRVHPFRWAIRRCPV